MRLEVRRLVSHPRVTRGVTLVESVAGKLLPVFPYLVEHLVLVAVLLASLIEKALQVVHLLDELLTHSLAQGVALASREACKLAAEEHDLLLVYGDSVSVLEVFLHARDVVLYLGRVALALDELRYVVHRARTVEGVHGYEVLEYGRMQLAKVFLHAGRLELERAYGAAFAVQLVRIGVVYRYGVKVDNLARSQADVLHRLLQD